MAKEKKDGLGMFSTVMFLAGSLAGGGMLTLPKSVENTGWIGLILIAVFSGIGGYCGVLLGRCWTIVCRQYPEYNHEFRYPYAAIAEHAVGLWMKYFISICLQVSLLGSCIVYLVLCAENMSSLATEATGVPFCYWIIIIGAALIPLTWFGSPKDFWPVAVIAFATSAITSILACVSLIINDHTDITKVPHHNPTFKSFFFASGGYFFAFGGAAIFPTVQKDMKEPEKLSRGVVIANSLLLMLYLPLSALGYLFLGPNLEDNILLSLHDGPLRQIGEFLMMSHVFVGYIVLINPCLQEWEDYCKLPAGVSFQRCIMRTFIVICTILIAMAVPHFGALLSFVGGSLMMVLSFIAPVLFYLCLHNQGLSYDGNPLPLHVKVFIFEIIIVAILGGSAATYSAIHQLLGKNTFVPPCFTNMNGVVVEGSVH